MQRPSWLRLVTTPPRDPRAVYAEDRQTLLAAVAALTGKTYTRPADALRDIAQALGYGVRRRHMNRWGLVDADARVIWLASNLREQLAHPGSTREVEIFTLAHEIGHVRLHEIELLAGHDLTDEQEAQANVYAAVFLMPQRQIRASSAFQRLVESDSYGERYEQVGRLAEEMRVSRSAMLRGLEDLRIARLDPETRRVELLAV